MALDDTMLVLDVQGVGYEVEVSANVIGALPLSGEPLTLHTHMVVREDAQLLFGFHSRPERDLFRAFIRINGVGPKLGLALISSLDLSALARIVANNDVAALTRVPGVGKKTAERLMLELKSRIDTLTQHAGPELSVVSVGSVAVSVVQEAEDALIALGYKPHDASKAVAAIAAEQGEEEPTAEALVRGALRMFANTGNVS